MSLTPGSPRLPAWLGLRVHQHSPHRSTRPKAEPRRLARDDRGTGVRDHSVLPPRTDLSSYGFCPRGRLHLPGGLKASPPLVMLPAGPEGAQQQASGCTVQRTCSGHELSGSALPHSSTGDHVALAPTQDLMAITSPGKSLGQRSWAAPPSLSQGDAQTTLGLPHPVTPVRRGAFKSRRCLGWVLAEQGARLASGLCPQVAGCLWLDSHPPLLTQRSNSKRGPQDVPAPRLNSQGIRKRSV